MTRFLLACLLWVATGSSLAQTLACQFIATAGLKWENGSWVTKTFFDKQPFFIGLNPDGKTIDKKTVTKLLTIPSCTGEQFITCSSVEGAFLYFSTDNLKGAYAATFGSVIDDSREKTTISVAPFICQKM